MNKFNKIFFTCMIPFVALFITFAVYTSYREYQDEIAYDKLKYVYFVSYMYTARNSHAFGYGNCQITLNEIINKIKYVSDMEDQLRKSNPTFNTLVVLNYQFLRRE